jgi:hypothetical protein
MGKTLIIVAFYPKGFTNYTERPTTRWLYKEEWR